MKLAKILTDEADEIILRARRKPDEITIDRALTFTHLVARDAYLAYLEGQTARSKALNKLADKVRIAVLNRKEAA